jgi:hypothetical protein
LFHDTTSDAIRQDALPNSGRMFVLYYRKGDAHCQEQENNILDVARNWGDYLTSTVRFYKVDVDADTDTGSRVAAVPTMVMVVPDSNGHLIVLNTAEGLLDHDQTYDFFVQGMKNPLASKFGVSYVQECTAADVAFYAHQHPVATLYYNSDSLLSLVERNLFEKEAQAHADMTFLAIDVTQDEQDSNRLGGIPTVVVYRENDDGQLEQSKPAAGLMDERSLERYIDSQFQP